MRSQLKALLAYLVLTLIFTYPLTPNFTTAIPGDGYDGWQNYWNLWWVRHALLDLNTTPFFTSALFYPDGASLLFHTLNVFNGLWTLPLQAFCNLACTYNSVVVFSFVISAYGAFLLARYTLAISSQHIRPSEARVGTVLFSGMGAVGSLAPFLAGCVFAFAPFRFAHLLGHMQVFSTEWLPFFALAFLRMQRQRAPLWRRAFWPAIFLTLTALCDWYFVLYLLILAAIVTFYRWLRMSHATIQSLADLLAVLASFVLLIAPLLIPMLRDGATASYLRPPFEESVLLSADLLAFVTPSEFHPLWGEAASAFAERFTSSVSERTVFVGYVTLLLAGIAVWRMRRHHATWLWLLIVLTFFMLALGPFLHIGGQIVSDWPMPYLWLYDLVPLMRITRSLSRYAVIVMLALSVLTALGSMALSSHWFSSTQSKAMRGAETKWIALLLIALLLFEFLAIPYPLTFVNIPAFYERLREEPGTFSVLELPISIDRPDPLVYQTIHARPLITAYTSRSNPLSRVERTPILSLLRTLTSDIVRYDTRTLAPSLLADLDVRYVINHPLTMGESDERTLTNRTLREIFGSAPPLVNEPNLIVYRAPAAPSPAAHQPYLILGDGWGALQQVNGKPQRMLAMATPATLQIMARAPSERILHIKGDAAGPLMLWLDDQPLGEFAFAAPAFTIAVPLHLSGRPQTLTLRVGARLALAEVALR